MNRRFARVAIATALVAMAAAIASCGSPTDNDGPGIVNPTRTLTIAGGSGSGRVTSSPGPIDCRITNGVASGTCTNLFPDKTGVTLTATPENDQLFKAWGGGDCAGATSCALTLTKDVSVSAGFVGKVATLQLTYQTPTTDDGAVLLVVTGPAITGIAAGSGLQIARGTRTSDGKTVLLVRGNKTLTSGGLGTVTVSGLDADKPFSTLVEQVAAIQNADSKLNYAQRPNPSAYTVTIK
ncbi:MAG TPA: hypothetical protein VM076_04850 [Gemmatimonadaceae bacterium]|nr:hypothetical protein [Gemmatimonadaceae bacterium]